MNNYKNMSRKTASKITLFIVLYLIAVTVSSIILSVNLVKKTREANELQSKLDEIRLCSLDVIDCDGEEKKEPVQMTTASWYDYDLNGVAWSKNHRTTASREFARGTLVKVTNVENGKSVVVVVNDYGPDASVFPDRALDLSSYAFGLIADKSAGVVEVEYQAVGTDPYYQSIN